MKARLRGAFPWLLIALGVLSWLQVWTPREGLSELLRFGEPFAAQSLPELQATPHVVHPNWGYDAQFYAQMAMRPLVADAEIAAAVDAPGYRFRRILPSWLAYLLGAGQPWWILQAYVLIHLAAWVGVGVMLLHWLPPTTGSHLFRWAACVFSLGAIDSVSLATPDLLGLFWVLLALRWLERPREWTAAGSLAAALLCKESYLIAGIIRLDGWGGGWSAWSRRLAFGFVATVPLALWLGYLAAIGYPPSGGSPENFTLPFAGLWYELREIVAFFEQGKFDNGVAGFSLLVQMGALLAIWRPGDARWRLGVAYVGLALFLGNAVWEGDVGAAYRVLLPVTVVFNLLLPDDRKSTWPILLLGNLSVLVGLKALLRFW